MGYRYSWQDGSPIRQIDVRRNAAGWLQVVIYAPENVTEKVLTLPNHLEKNKITSYLDEIDTKSVLKIADMGKKDDRFLALLRDEGFVTGPLNKEEIPDETPKLGLLGAIRKYSLNASGILGELGHISLITQGLYKNDQGKRNTKNIATGAFYAVSTALPAAFGSGKGAIRFSRITNDLRNYLNKEGFKLADPLIDTPQIKYRDRGVFSSFWDTVKSHPVQTQNMISLPGNILLAMSGREESAKTGGASGAGYIVSGLLAALGGIIAIVIPEATPEKLEELKNKKGFRQTLKEEGVWAAVKTIPDKIYMGISRMPLVFYGGLLAIENIFGIDRQFVQVMKRYTEAKHDPTKEKMDIHTPILTGVQAVGWTSSSLTGTLGSKTRDKSLETKEAYDGLYAQTANIILEVPHDFQNLVIHKSAEFLATQPDVHVHASEIGQQLTNKINLLRNNPWTSKVIATEERNNKNDYVETGINQLQDYANDPTNAISVSNRATQPILPARTDDKAPPPNSVLEAVKAEALLEQQKLRD